MKKMQCEVCGSVDIKKLDDTTFECQNCGIQYDVTEFENKINESDTVQECETPVDEKTIDKYNCDVEFQSFVKDSKDKILISPTKADLEKYFNKTVSKMPEDRILIIESNIQEKRFDSIEIFGNSDKTVSLSVKLEGEKYNTLNLNKNEAWLFVCEYAQSGNIENNRIILENKSTPVKNKSVEKWIRFFGIMGIFPGLSLLGIIPLLLSNKAKKNNDGVLSQATKYDIILGLCGFIGWTLFFFVLLCMV